MPLKHGTSQKTFDSNVGEILKSYAKTGKIGTSKPTTNIKARKQALAAAFDMKTRSYK